MIPRRWDHPDLVGRPARPLGEWCPVDGVRGDTTRRVMVYRDARRQREARL
ncbi:MAG: hypothetical protein MZV65_35655 [Chromatiales bacterium]|nr:hypothetical protein [Chromatiales bacterium]